MNINTKSIHLSIFYKLNHEKMRIIHNVIFFLVIMCVMLGGTVARTIDRKPRAVYKINCHPNEIFIRGKCRSLVRPSFLYSLLCNTYDITLIFLQYVCRYIKYSIENWFWKFLALNWCRLFVLSLCCFGIVTFSFLQSYMLPFLF